MDDQSIVVVPGASPTPPPQSPNSIFRGLNGIRAGWRALIFLAIIAGFVAVLNLVVILALHFLKPGGTRAIRRRH